MEFDFSAAFELFLRSLVYGAVLGVLYDIFKALRIFTGEKAIITFFADLLFMLVCSFGFAILYYNFSRGAIRLYAVLSAGITFLAYRKTVGKITDRILKMTARAAAAVFVGIKRRMGYRKSLIKAEFANRELISGGKRDGKKSKNKLCRASGTGKFNCVRGFFCRQAGVQSRGA